MADTGIKDIQETENNTLVTSQVIPYTTVPNRVLEDTNFSLKAKGLLAIMLCFCNRKQKNGKAWTFNRNHLMKISSDGDCSFRTALKEIRDRDYLRITPIKDVEKKIRGWQWTLIIENIFDMEKPHVEKPHVEKPHHSIKDISIKDINKKNNVPYEEIIEHLNRKSKRIFKPNSKATKKLINTRWAEGWKLEDFKLAIDNCCNDWLDNPKMCKLIRPKTIFNEDNFEGYVVNMRTKYSGIDSREAKDKEYKKQEAKYRGLAKKEITLQTNKARLN